MVSFSEKVINIDKIYHNVLQMSSNLKLELGKVSRIFNALGNETRVRILLLINKTKRPLHIKAIAEALDMDYAALYRHVKVLQRSGLLIVYDVGRSRVLSLKNSEATLQLLNNANIILQ